METLRDDWPYATRQASKPMNIIVVGAGIGGLIAGLALARTGHSVTVLERVAELSEVGAGIQIAPNASRILHRVGVLEEVIRRYLSDDELSNSPLMPSTGLKYGAPTCVIHRADLHMILLDAARASGCHILTSHTVLSVDAAFSARVLVHNTKTGTTSWFSGDIVIAADGIKSTIRKQMTNMDGHSDRPISTGDAAYRLLIPRSKIQHEPQLLEMLEQNVAMRYMGPGGHVVAYPVKQNQVYNIVLLHPANPSSYLDDTEDYWTHKGNRKEMLEFYSDWSPAIRQWLRYADEEILEWSLYVYPPIPRWTRGSVALMGDACNPMLPYVAQGAANAMEDAVVLATALTCTSDISVALRVYELVRKDRGEQIAASASTTARTLHLPDGPEQVQRDEAIVNAGKGGEHPDKWGNAKWQDFMWGTDIMRYTMENWTSLAASVEMESDLNCIARIQEQDRPVGEASCKSSFVGRCESSDEINVQKMGSMQPTAKRSQVVCST